MAKQSEGTKTLDIGAMIDELVTNAQEALAQYMTMNQEQVDKIVYAMTLAGIDHHMELAHAAIDETGRGVFEDKVIKNLFATDYIWNSIKYEKTVDVIEENELEGYVEVAEPVGVVAGVTPVTNPTSTTMFKSLITQKTRNPIIFGFHPSAQQCSVQAAKLLRDAAVAAGAPEHCIQWIEHPSIEATSALMNHPGVSLILATGGAGMVRSAYSAGKPALGVGPGNVPCYINKNVDVERACTDLMISKTFDNGMICASEQAVIVDQEISAQFERIMKENNCYFLDEEEIKKVTAYVINPEKMAVNPAVVGKSAAWIAANAGVKVPEKTKILLAKLPRPSREYPLSLEKLSPVLAYFVVEDADQGFAYAQKMLELGGSGPLRGDPFQRRRDVQALRRDDEGGARDCQLPFLPGRDRRPVQHQHPLPNAGLRVLGRNSTTSNVSSVNLINKKRIAKRRVNMQWFKIPPKIYFEYDSVQYLRDMPNISRAFIVTDAMMAKLGYVDKVVYYLENRREPVHYEVFTEVEPDPSVETIMRGVKAMNSFQPDVIIALGGGSAIDAAKGMWLFYEAPDSSFDGLKLKFLDIRKRAVHFPNLGKKAQMVAIPTTSGTGSEVTNFAVITDKQNGNIKYPLADYELTPDVAIIDPQFVLSMPKSIVADTGLDVLTHALEAFVSVLASDYTNGLAIKAIELVFKYLPRSYENPNDVEAREKMHNASCIAGMAFTNAFLGINHSLAHKLGGEYHIPHGRANAVLLPYVVDYNSHKPTKFASWPKYGKFMAAYRYAQVSRYLGFGGATEREQVDNLIKAIRDLMKRVNIPMSIKECGVDESEFMSKLPKLAEKAFEDQCTTANPRYPLVSELEEIYRKAYYGE